VLTDDELEHRMKLEYEQYLEEEAVFLRDLGLVKDDLAPAAEPLAVAWLPLIDGLSPLDTRLMSFMQATMTVNAVALSANPQQRALQKLSVLLLIITR